MIAVIRTAIALEEGELIEFQRTIVDRDEKEALKFLKKSIFGKVFHSQKGRLKSHLDSGGENSVETFKRKVDNA